MFSAPRKKPWCFSFVDYPVYSTFKLQCPYSSFLFWFASIHPKCVCKSLFFLNFSLYSDVASFVVYPMPCLCIAFWNYKVHWLLTFHVKSFSFLETFGAPLKKSSNIAPFTEHPVYIIFKVENALNLTCWFSYNTSSPNSVFKTYLFLNFECSANKVPIFFFLWSTLNKVFSMCKVSWFLIVDLTLSPSIPNSTCKTFLFSKF